MLEKAGLYKPVDGSYPIPSDAVIIPHAEERGAGDSGVLFGTKRLPYNLVEAIPGGGERVTAVSAELADKIANAKGPIGVDAALEMARAGLSVPRQHARATVVPLTGEAALALSASSAAVPAQPAPQVIKVPVTFAGAFGKVSIPYDLVFISGNVLVLVRMSSDSASFTAPETDEHIRITLSGKSYWCLSGIEFTMPDGVTSFHLLKLLRDRVVIVVDVRRIIALTLDMTSIERDHAGA